jgi:hypothetical protein
MSRSHLDLARIEVLDADQPNSTTTLATLNNVQFGVLANVRYAFRFVLAYTSAATATGARFVLQGPAFTLLAGRTTVTLTATTVGTTNFTAYGIPAAASATSLLAGNLAVVDGIIRPSASGTLTLQFASEVAASAITVLAGSHATLQPLRAS